MPEEKKHEVNLKTSLLSDKKICSYWDMFLKMKILVLDIDVENHDQVFESLESILKNYL